MKGYDVIMKGPPRWFVRGAVLLLVLVVGVQLGLWQERSKNTTEAIRAETAKQAMEIDRLKIALNEARFNVEIEREKFSILTCESNIRHKGIWGDGGKSYGIAQFQLATFKDLREKAGRPELRWKNRDDQIWLLDWALRNGYGRYWTCFQKAGSRGQDQGARVQGPGSSSQGKLEGRS